MTTLGVLPWDGSTYSTIPAKQVIVNSVVLAAETTFSTAKADWGNPLAVDDPGSYSAGVVTDAQALTDAAQSFVVVYADSSGTPGALLGTSGVLTGISAGIKTYTFSPALDLAAGTYWVGIMTGGYSIPADPTSQYPRFRVPADVTLTDAFTHTQTTFTAPNPFGTPWFIGPGVVYPPVVYLEYTAPVIPVPRIAGPIEMGGTDAPPSPHHLLYLKMSEAVSTAGLKDEISGLSLTQAGNPGVITPPGRGRSFDGTAQYAYGLGGAADAAKLRSEWSIEVQLQLTATLADWTPLVVFTQPNGNTTAADSHLASVHVMADGSLGVYWEQQPSGPYTSVQQTTGVTLSVGQVARVVVSKSLNFSGLYDVSFYINGSLVQTVSNKQNSGGGSNGAWIIAGDSSASAHAPVATTRVNMAEVIVYDYPLSAREVYNNWVAATRADRSFGLMLKQLLPRGTLWLLEAASGISRLLSAIGDEFTRVSRRAADILEEADPRTATETLPDWERVLGLPDELVTDIPSTLAARRVAVTQKSVKTGGQRPEYFVSLAAACGYTVTVVDGSTAAVSRSGTMRSGDPLANFSFAFYWQVVVSATAVGALTHTQFEAVINSAKPAHTIVTFSY